MDERTWQRIGAWAGIGFFVLSVLATFLYPQPPRPDSDPAVVLRWAHTHRAGLEAGMALGIVAAMSLVWFVASLRHLLARAGAEALSSVVYGSGMALVAVFALGAAPVATLVFMDGQPGGVNDGAVVRLLIDLNQILFSPAAGLAAVLLLAAGIAMLSTKVLPPAVGWAAIVVAALDGIEVVTSLTFSSYHAGLWTVIGWGGYLGLLVMIPLIGIAGLRRPEPAPALAAVTS